MQRVTSITDRPADSRWHTTMPPRRSLSAASLGLLWAVRGLQVFGVLLLIADLGAMPFLRHASTQAATAALTIGCEVGLTLLAIATLIAWHATQARHQQQLARNGDGS